MNLTAPPAKEKATADHVTINAAHKIMLRITTYIRQHTDDVSMEARTNVPNGNIVGGLHVHLYSRTGESTSYIYDIRMMLDIGAKWEGVVDARTQKMLEELIV